MNIAHLLATPLAERATSVAIVHGPDRSRETTFAALDESARRMASVFRRDGVNSGDRVLFFAAPSAQMYAALIATWRVGAVATFVELSAGRGVLEAACALCTPRAFVASRKAHLLRFVSPALRAIPRKYSVDGWLPFTSSLNGTDTATPNDIAQVSADDVALLTFTSGSTGKPKGAMRTHAILRAQLAALTSAFAAQPGDCEMVALPIVVLLNLANGVQTVLPNVDLRRPDAYDVRPVIEQIESAKISRLIASPAFVDRLCDNELAPRALGNMRTIVTGGGPVFPDLVRRAHAVAPNANIISVYGSTEAEPIAHIANGDVTQSDLKMMEQGGGLLTGHPVSDVTLRLLHIVDGPITAATTDALDALTVERGMPGEIVVSGTHVVRGYWHGHGDAETKIRIDQTIWHRTGDLGRLDERGRLWLLGRVNAAFHDNRGWFYPFAVECAARTLLGCRRVAAFARNGKRVLVVESRNAASLTKEIVQRAMPWADLDEVRGVKRIPMDKRHNSKVDYPALLRERKFRAL